MHVQHHTQMAAFLGRIRQWWSNLDLALKVHAVVCVMPMMVMLFTPGPNAVDRSGYEYSIFEFLVQWLIGIPALFLFTPVVGASQFGLFWFSRRLPDAWMRWLFCLVAIILLQPYRNFLQHTDLTSNSTAALAAMFYPLYWAVGVIPLAAAIWWIRLWFMRHDKS